MVFTRTGRYLFFNSRRNKNIDSSGNKDINNPVIWVIIIAIFVPVAIGLMIFGWYAITNEYEQLPEDSDHLNFE
ncbi:hypothetical protein LWM68_24805 [Niabella sp. W65]|nr:hypothetical protein [Niabella sp. W65]MCH7365706.1 hypothetical protein [Niabella sp. W65]ULT41471.1 hypothetical protein KRR40_43720 [Niabella sp. I65]